MASSRTGRRSLSDKAAKPAKRLLDLASDNEEDHELASPEMLAELALAAATEAGDEVPLTDAGVMAPLTANPPIGDGPDGIGLGEVAASGRTAAIGAASTPLPLEKVGRCT
jgi:hypothetical protein